MSLGRVLKPILMSGAVAMLVAVPFTAASAKIIKNDVAVFAGLDKITGRIIRFDVKVDETVQFGALQVTPRSCYTRPPSEKPKTTAFIEVDEVTLDRKVREIFQGWMFASSPGLHAVEHAVYDVWLADCKGAEQFNAQPVTNKTDEFGTRGFDDDSVQQTPDDVPLPKPRPAIL